MKKKKQTCDDCDYKKELDEEYARLLRSLRDSLHENRECAEVLYQEEEEEK